MARNSLEELLGLDNPQQVELQMEFDEPQQINVPKPMFPYEPTPLPQQQELVRGPQIANPEDIIEDTTLDDRRSRFEGLLSQLRSQGNQEELPQAPTLDVAQQPSNAMAEAIKQRNEQQRQAQLLRAFSKMIQGGARIGGAKIGAGSEFADVMEKQAGQPVTDIQMSEAAKQRAEKQNLIMKDLQQKIQKGTVDLQDAEAARDPGSQQSKFIQDQFIEMQKAMGKPVNEEAIRQQTAQSLFKVSPWMQKVHADSLKRELDERRLGVQEKRLGQADERIELQEKEQAQREKQEERRIASFAKSYRDKMLTDPRFKNLKSQEQAFQQIPSIKEAAQAGNEVAVSSIGTRMARAMGEVGVLTDADVVRYLGNQSYGRKLLDWYNRGMKGQIPIQTGEDIQQVSEIMQNLVNTQIIPVYGEYASAMSAAYPGAIDPERALKILGAPGFVDPTMGKLMEDKLGGAADDKASADKVETPYGETVEKDGKKYKWNPARKKYQLIEAPNAKP